MLHGSQHLRHDDKWLARRPAGGRNILLHGRQMPQWHIVPQVSPGDDDDIRLGQDVR